ncbi:hypothetical protein EV363DRAFT_1314817 [Boletus edulis]|nr:hypothetical protein EV363DRAFT_1314817 [Boletus edulis]
MSEPSSLESAVKDIHIDCCAAVMIIAAVGYDYLLTLSREIESIWCRPWTRVSVLFVVVRYIGLCWAITFVVGSAFVPGPVKVSTAMLMVGDWGYIVFLAAADLVMILRVYAMWDQSRIILGVLLFIYVPQVIVSAVWEGIYNYPNKTISVTVVQVLNFRYCSYAPRATPSATYRAIPRFVLGSTLLILAAIPTFKQLVDMYKLTKRWETNRPMQLLLREGSVYFVVNLLFNIVNALRLPVVGLMLFLDTLSYSLSCAIMPRFIISIRELYDRNLENRWQGIDSGFGLSMHVSPEEGQAGTEDEVIQLEVHGDGAHLV